MFQRPSQSRRTNRFQPDIVFDGDRFIPRRVRPPARTLMKMKSAPEILRASA
jgi:hypothetical protein